MSVLKQAVHDYLTRRRGLGFKLKKHSRFLDEFVAYLERAGAQHITSHLALQWATEPQHIQQAEWAARLGVVRGFARYWSATDPMTEIPPKGLLPYRARRAKPYLYTDEEIQQLLEAARNMPATHPLQPWTYHCLFGLLAVTGLRISEALHLRCTDVDWSEGVLAIHNAKFGKSRLIPLHASTLNVLSDYSAHRNRLFVARKNPTSFARVMTDGSTQGRSVEYFMCSPDRLVFAALRPAAAHGCMTSVIVSQSSRCCTGIAPGKMFAAVCPFCPPISGTDMSPIPTGT